MRVKQASRKADIRKRSQHIVLALVVTLTASIAPVTAAASAASAPTTSASACDAEWGSVVKKRAS